MNRENAGRGLTSIRDTIQDETTQILEKIRTKSSNDEALKLRIH